MSPSNSKYNTAGINHFTKRKSISTKLRGKESPSFGYSSRFKVLPPDSLAHTNLPGPGAYKDTTLSMANQLKIKDPIAVVRRSESFASLKNKNRANEMKMNMIWGEQNVKDKVNQEEDANEKKKMSSTNKRQLSATSSFSGQERDTMKLMARFGKAPLLDPKPVVMDNLPTFKLPPSPLLRVSHNVTAFHPSPIMKQNKKNMKKTKTLLKTQLKPREEWFSRTSVPSLNDVQNSPVHMNQNNRNKILKNMKLKNISRKKLDLEEVKSSFFDEKNRIKGKHKEKVTKIF